MEALDPKGIMNTLKKIFSCRRRGLDPARFSTTLTEPPWQFCTYWKLRMDIYGLVSIQPSQPKQAILRNGFDFNVFFSVAYAPLDLGGEWLVVHWLKMIT